MPIRPNWDGQLSIPGDGRYYEWKGLLSPRKLPSLKDPAQGYVATANQDNLTQFGVPEVPISFDFSNPVRANRLIEIFAGKAKFSVAEGTAIQLDKRNGDGLRLAKLFGDMVTAGPEARRINSSSNRRPRRSQPSLRSMR